MPLLYVWTFVSVAVLIRRRGTGGSFWPTVGWGRSGRDATPPTLSDAGLAPPPAPPIAQSTLGRRTESDPRVGAHETPQDTAPVVVVDRPSTVADAVAGISMPCGLVPVILDRQDPRHVAFSTTGHEPAAVGTAMADELERLGFDITALDERSVRAARRDAVLELRIWSSHLDSAEIFAKRFPGVTAHSLVIDIRLP